MLILLFAGHINSTIRILIKYLYCFTYINPKTLGKKFVENVDFFGATTLIPYPEKNTFPRRASSYT